MINSLGCKKTKCVKSKYVNFVRQNMVYLHETTNPQQDRLYWGKWKYWKHEMNSDCDHAE